MQGGRFRSNRLAKEKRQRGDGNGGHHGGHGNGNGGGNNNGNGNGNGGNDGDNDGGDDDDPTTTATPAAAATTTQEETTSAAAATTPTITLTAETTSEDATPVATLTPEVTSSSRSTDESGDSTTTTAEQITSSTSAGSEETGLSSALSDETSSWDMGTLATDTTAAQAVASETGSGTLSATSSASSSSSSSSSRAGVIAGVIIGLFLLLALGFLIYRLRRTRHMQRVLAHTPFRKHDEDATPGPYQTMDDKADGAMGHNMTGETLVAVHAMRAHGPSSPKPPPKDTKLTLDTGYYAPARFSTVSPVSAVSELGPEVSPISPTASRPPSHVLPPAPQPSLASATATRGSVGTARSITGSEAKIVTIPARTSRSGSKDRGIASGPPDRNLTGGGGGPPERKAVPHRMPEAARGWAYPDRAPPYGPVEAIPYGGGGGGNGGAWRPPAPGQQPRQPPRQRPMGPSDAIRAPPPLSIPRSKQAPMWSPQQNAPHPAAAANNNNGGYQAYNPPPYVADGPRGPPPLNTDFGNRASRGSVSGASMASSDVFSLTDAVSWPKPPSTPTVMSMSPSPDRH